MSESAGHGASPSQSRPSSAGDDSLPKANLRLWYLISAVYILFVGLMVFDRRGEIGSLFEPVKPGEARLPLHNIGDLLAGIFAPLAFLWLFAATQLQRKELIFQRIELKETRQVLASQQVELEKAAEESNRQTAIMQETLKTADAKSVYELFCYMLYLVCRRAYQNADCEFETRHTTYKIMRITPALYLSETDNSIINTYIEKTHANLEWFNARYLSEDNSISFREEETLKIIASLRFLHGALSDINSDGAYLNNNYIRLRLRDVPFSPLLEELSKIIRWIDSLDPSNLPEDTESPL